MSEKGGVYCVFMSFLCALLLFYIMGSLKCPLLTSHNYFTWKDIVWSRLMTKILNLYVDGTIPKPTDAKELIHWKIIDNRALRIIKSCVHRDLFFHVANVTKSKPIWDKLESLYGKVDEEKEF